MSVRGLFRLACCMLVEAELMRMIRRGRFVVDGADTMLFANQIAYGRPVTRCTIAYSADICMPLLSE